MKENKGTRACIRNNMKKLASCKRSQEEMVGFVLIIILVAVIVVVFLAISIRKPVEIKQNKEIKNFLQSSLLYTTFCYKSPEIVYNLKDLIKACYDNEKCADEKESCEVLKQEYEKLIANSWVISSSSEEKAYVFSIYDKANSTLLFLAKGEKAGTKKQANLRIYAYGNDIYLDMQIFY